MPKLIYEADDHPDMPEAVVHFEHIQVGHGDVPDYCHMRLPGYVIAFIHRSSLDGLIAALQDEQARMRKSDSEAGHG